LRKLAAKYLPDTLINQPKRGFEVPLKQWVNHQLKDMINDYLTASNALNRSVLQPQFMQQLMGNQSKIPAEKRAKMLWTLLSMEVWYQNSYLAASKSNSRTD